MGRLVLGCPGPGTHKGERGQKRKKREKEEERKKEGERKEKEKTEEKKGKKTRDQYGPVIPCLGFAGRLCTSLYTRPFMLQLGNRPQVGLHIMDIGP